jgi:N-acetyl-1-D-myo-inositol-2-amino-2-deoxy-alpha-D-glucopyranoside deacetylase
VALPSVLAVFAHPDDESLSAGGLLARHAAAGARTTVLTTTWAPGTIRSGELADATRLLGAGGPRMLGYADARVPDSAPGRPRLVDAPVDEAVARLVRHLRELRPDIVVTHDVHGGATGHPDHAHTHRLAVQATYAAGEASAYPDSGGDPWRVGSILLATHPHSARPMLTDLVGDRRTVHTVPDDEATALDVTPWLEHKVAAILAHRSEVERGALPGVVAGLAPEKRRRLLSTEWYVRRKVRAPEV